MYRRPKFLEVLLEIRQEMARQADYDVDLFTEMVRGDKFPKAGRSFELSEAKVEKSLNGKAAHRRKSPIANRKF
jgi:hypothetical protein